MDKNEKLLRKLSKEDRDRIILAVALIHSNDFQMLDFKKLSGVKDLYRVRVGKFRIKFRTHTTYNEIIEIVRRNDNTY
ncbi:hypothetical protein A2914_00765 [Candidatus Nomurabacteria bacterium RIFCSPLOWO2_01_FULL_41_21]|uniref:Plasmid stabilization protein n=2 Tax=Candidatus Nomuraibacteriota TaxID=1752729 RepID=A0A1F6V3F9_9BACT|nr:MAG: hypothetical protein A2733_03125 [Candidatus Nomurabacteria bacterium RIFCSPHIGHO2_01_FULL_40_20]OGI88370.1 MAG: hypothetical protein A2914_00765 [Candidatus Nomurabacteria bacterium RIFCSPLOWO2_01_FULL_41_21]